MYILICGNGTYYTGSTRNLARRLMQHQSGKGAIHTTMHQPVVLIYSEEFSRIDHAFIVKNRFKGGHMIKKLLLLKEKLKH